MTEFTHRARVAPGEASDTREETVRTVHLVNQIVGAVLANRTYVSHQDTGGCFF